jgi:hypothetical protein
MITENYKKNDLLFANFFRRNASFAFSKRGNVFSKVTLKAFEHYDDPRVGNRKRNQQPEVQGRQPESFHSCLCMIFLFHQSLQLFSTGPQN